jgi:hypothetical protein
MLHFVLCAVTLSGLCAYSAIVGPRRVVTLPEVLANPATSAGVELRLPLSTKVVQVLPRAFQIEQHGVQLSVRVPADLEQEWKVWGEQLQVHDAVSLRAVFHPEGSLILRDMHIHKGRGLKIWVSVFALFLLAGILLHERRKVAHDHA